MLKESVDTASGVGAHLFVVMSADVGSLLRQNLELHPVMFHCLQGQN